MSESQFFLCITFAGVKFKGRERKSRVVQATGANIREMPIFYGCLLSKDYGITITSSHGLLPLAHNRGHSNKKYSQN